MMIDSQRHYSIYAVDKQGNVVASKNPDALVESASMIKSPLAALALLNMVECGQTLSYPIVVEPYHIAHNATTFMTHASMRCNPSMRHLSGDRYETSLGTLLKNSIADSDATATNVLIAHLGMDCVNDRFEHIGLHNTELLIHHLDFDEMDQPCLLPRVGRTTMRAMVNYFTNIESILSEADQEASGYFTEIHRQVRRVRLLSCQREDLKSSVEFTHKTGSIFDIFKDGSGQAIIADSGILKTGHKEVVVAAHAAIFNKNGLAGVNREFANDNMQHLGLESTELYSSI